MRLRKGYKIVNDRGQVGIIDGFDSKNSRCIVSYEGVEGSSPRWCYREQIIEAYKPNGKRIY